MYLAGIKSILELSEQVVERALQGDIEGARSRYDRARAMRSRLARVVASDKGQAAAYFQEHMGVQLADEAEEAPSNLTEGELAIYRSQVSRLNTVLGLIREWLQSSRAAFSAEELISSRDGINLILDCSIPEVWDFSQDVAVLCGAQSRKLFSALANRGQKNFVVLLDNSSLQASEFLAESQKAEPITIDSHQIVFWDVWQPPDASALTTLVCDEVPTISLFGCTISEAHENAFRQVATFLSQQTLGVRSLKEWPVVFIEQWLGQLHQMTRFRSAAELRVTLASRDILIASPGPSLIDSINQLKYHRSLFTLIVPLRSLSFLLSEKIIPDFVLHVDATDFSKFLPASTSLRGVSLICFDHCHPSVWKAGFDSVFTLPEPHLIGSDLALTLHGEHAPQLPGGSVSVVAAELAAAYGCASITLLGQDLSISRGQYVGDTDQNAFVREKEPSTVVLTCKGIDGNRLPTLEDYMWFISEFEQTARKYADKILLVNSTSQGALLEGWKHLRLDEHPLVSGLPSRSRLTSLAIPRALDETEHSTRCKRLVLSLRNEGRLAAGVAQLCETLGVMCQQLVDDGSTDVRSLEAKEYELKLQLSSPGSISHFYTSRYAVALKAAVGSVKSLEENLAVSAEYYQQLVPRANKLSMLLEKAADKIDNMARGSH